MATGDVKWFAEGIWNMGKKLVDLSADTIKLGIITNLGTIPAVGLADPRWGAGGGTNLSSSQVAIGGTSYTAPITLSTPSWTVVSGVPTLRAGTVSLAQDAAGFEDGAYGIIYSDTSTGKIALGWVEISAAGVASLRSGPITIDWSGANNDILTITQS